jgi:hypothetical protein
MEIGEWRATRDLNDLYREIRDLGLETNLAELEAFGFTVIAATRCSPTCSSRARSSKRRS